MFVTLKIFHFIGLMLGGGAGFGLMLLAPALRRADAAGKAALMPLRPKLANLGLLGIVLLWISGLGMAFMVGSYGLSGLWFGLKMLAAAGVLEGRKCSAYPACQPEVELAGGTFAGIEVDQAVTDANLVTAPAWPAHPAWLAQFFKLLDQ